MKMIQAGIFAALASALTAHAGDVAQPKHPEKPTYTYEKCYGVARAGYNDCFTHKNSCGGTVREDRRADAWIYLPRGTCTKIIGGSLEPRSG